jgi:hypothetical protein
MTAALAGTTTLLSVGCRKNAFALPAFCSTLHGLSPHPKTARKRAFCTSHRLRPASDISVAGDDPVNEADPTRRDSKYGVTTGICGNVVAAIGLGIGLGIEGLPCWLSSSSGSPGVSFTLGIPGLNLGAVLSASVDFVVSDAGNVKEMGGPRAGAVAGAASR